MAQYTPEQMREMFLNHCRTLVDYWAKVERETTHELLSGLLFSVLAMLDGESVELPGFELIPAPHPSDKEYSEKRGDNWWPPMPEDLMERDDIFTVHGGFMLHDMLYAGWPENKEDTDET
jgi:hypothetical protein